MDASAHPVCLAVGESHDDQSTAFLYDVVDLLEFLPPVESTAGRTPSASLDAGVRSSACMSPDGARASYC